MLHRKGTAKPQLTLLKSGTVLAGEKIDLRDQRDANLWLEIDLEPTVLGRLWRFLYKSPEVQLVARSQPETPNPDRFNAPAAMLSAGFLASPMILDVADFMKLYTGDKVSLPDSYSVEIAPTLVNVWQPEIHYRIYRLGKKVEAHSP